MKGMISNCAEVTFLLFGVNADSSVIEEQEQSLRDNNNWGLQKQQSFRDCQELACRTHEKPRVIRVWRTKAVGNCTVNAWDGTLEEFVEIPWKEQKAR